MKPTLHLQRGDRAGLRVRARPGRAMWWVLGVIALLLLAVAGWVYLRIQPMKWVDYAAEYEKLLVERGHLPSDSAPADAAHSASVATEFARLEALVFSIEQEANKRIVEENERRQKEHDQRFASGAPYADLQLLMRSDITMILVRDADPIEHEVAYEILRELEATDYFDAVRALADHPALRNPGFLRFDQAGLEHHLVKAARSLRSRAIARLADGNWRDALDSLEQQPLLANLAQRRPGVVNAAIGAGMLTSVLDGLRAIAREGSIDVEAIGLVEVFVQGLDTSSDLAFHMNGERLMLLDYLQRVHHGDPAVVTARPSLESRLLAPHGALVREIERIFARAQMAIPLDPVQRRRAAVHQFSEEDYDYEFTRKLAGQMHSDAMCSHRLELARGATLIALALERHRQTLGEYPESLESLVPQFINELPKDPYADDGGFVYRRITSEKIIRVNYEYVDYRLYSVWTDGLEGNGAGPGDVDFSPTAPSDGP